MAVEAKSLSSITALASNPPAYPRNPTHVRHDPVVLYIARVPGSKDVFLTPIKPREKVVTAEDIQSSLYYLHVNQPEDVRLLTPPGSEDSSEPPPYPDHPPVPSIPRKAVPTPNPSSNAPLRRKPVPSPTGSGFPYRQETEASSYYQASSSNQGYKRAPEPPLYSSLAIPESEDILPPLPRRPTGTPTPTGTTLTLIRRDPASNAQWNVATIDDPPVYDVSSAALHDRSPKKKHASPVYIDITNPGYSKFLHNVERPALVSRHGSDLSVKSHTTTSTSNLTTKGATPPFAPSPQPFDGEDDAPHDTVFRRRLWMESSKQPAVSFGHKRGSSYEGSITPQDRRALSEATASDSRPSSMHLSEDPGFKQSSFRGYVFKSPWNGRCEFVTGAAGGSLKCRHIIPTLGSLVNSPPTAVQISELRFNLPSSTKPASSTSEDASKRSILHRSRHSRNDSVSEMDLSLGQEYAGGGFGGKQAKLGKLIIEDEGLKMVDLLVAANMALWWRAYERVDAGGRSRGDRATI
ncbi:hypothetical protein M011DRAFT_444120 [Sporormia fimetaria CBS 119925]|uniref:Uncharacterized protein n=1 Tax=Sporormia fimetaria CBS 119925 TaxID=1340428 RepID=A0A6A6V8W0_9PLEO|nr:hypothetical protein M011DRAFT_444120 [Sporormia fimetaria CBS 119925]